MSALLRLVLVLISLDLVASTPRAGSTDADETSARRSPFEVRFALDGRYDDNIIQLNAHDRRRFDANPRSSRFRIASVDDDVVVGRVDVSLKVRALKRRTTKLALSGDAYEYSRNAIKSYLDLRLAVSQEISASRRHLTTLHAWFERTPHFYLRQLTDDDASFQARRRIRDDLTYAQNGLGIGLNQEILPGHLTGRLAAHREKRNYNSHFNERDGVDDSGSVSMSLLPLRSTILQIGVGYERGLLRARGDLPSSPFLDDDISYRQHASSIEASLAWRGRARGHIELGAERERREYTTGDPFDTARFGRVDDRRDERLRLFQGVGARFELSLEARHSTKHAILPAAVQSGEDETDYAESRYTFGLAWRFGL